MHDIRAIRENPDAFDAALARRGAAPVSAAILALDETRDAFAPVMWVSDPAWPGDLVQIAGFRLELPVAAG